MLAMFIQKTKQPETAPEKRQEMLSSCPGHFATAPEQPPANDLDLSAVQVAPVGFLDGGLLAPAPLVESHHRHPCGLLECRCSVGVNYHDVSRTNDSDARMK